MSDSIKIFHNPKCSKSRKTMELLSEKGLQPQIIEYLKTPPDQKQLEGILDMLNLQPRQLMRTHESEYKDNNLANESLSRDQLIAAMIQFPKLIERPIVINNGKAAIGRPPETILEIL
jgi:arsenate reductase (glutaredoxin)